MFKFLVLSIVSMFSFSNVSAASLDYTDNVVIEESSLIEKNFASMGNNTYIGGCDEFGNERCYDMLLDRLYQYGVLHNDYFMDGAWHHYDEFNSYVMYFTEWNRLNTDPSHVIFKYYDGDIYVVYYNTTNTATKNCFGIKYWHAAWVGQVQTDTYLCTCYYFNYNGDIYSVPTSSFSISNSSQKICIEFTGDKHVEYGDTFPQNYVGWYYVYDQYMIYQGSYSQGYQDGYGSGYQIGYDSGIDVGQQYDPTAYSIMLGILEIGLLPVNVFLAIFNFEVFGINISGFISALLTISVIIIILRFLFGNKND